MTRLTEQQPRCYSYVRFSTRDQLSGDSLRRQLESSEKWANEHGLVIDELKLHDLGVSAFKGKHRQQGALKIFEDAVKAGRIPVGSYLLVEALDRLSRENVKKAAANFLNIINNGITVNRHELGNSIEYLHSITTNLENIPNLENTPHSLDYSKSLKGHQKVTSYLGYSWMPAYR